MGEIPGQSINIFAVDILTYEELLVVIGLCIGGPDWYGAGWAGEGSVILQDRLAAGELSLVDSRE